MTEPSKAEATAEDRTTRRLVWLFGGLAALTLFLLMAVTVVDVTGRYLFNAPLPGSSEITELLMAILIFAALPAVARVERHITVDLLDAITPARLVIPRQTVTNLVAAIALAILAWRLWVFADQISADGVVTEYLHLAHAPFIYYMSVLSALAAVVTFGNALRYLRGATQPPADPL